MFQLPLDVRCIVWRWVRFRQARAKLYMHLRARARVNYAPRQLWQRQSQELQVVLRIGDTHKVIRLTKHLTRPSTAVSYNVDQDTGKIEVSLIAQFDEPYLYLVTFKRLERWHLGMVNVPGWIHSIRGALPHLYSTM